MHVFVGLILAVLGPLVPPVDAPISDHFRPPSCAYCAGNRGIDYAVESETTVRAAASGVVTFAGRVGRDQFIVVAHRDGLRTTYGYLSEISVVTAEVVLAGSPLGTATGTFHFGVRQGTRYLDPELLFGIGRVSPSRGRLVPPSTPKASYWLALDAGSG